MRWAEPILIVSALCAGATARAQEAVGPVAPRRAQSEKLTVEAYRDQLDDLMRAKAQDKLWKGLSPEERKKFMQHLGITSDSVERWVLSPVGPVPPKPPDPKPPGDPSTPPTKKDLDDELKSLKDALDKANLKDPNQKLPASQDRELQKLLQDLAKAKST